MQNYKCYLRATTTFTYRSILVIRTFDDTSLKLCYGDKTSQVNYRMCEIIVQLSIKHGDVSAGALIFQKCLKFKQNSHVRVAFRTNNALV